MISRRIIAALIAALLLMGCAVGALATEAATVEATATPEASATAQETAQPVTPAPETPEPTQTPAVEPTAEPTVEPTPEPVPEVKPDRLYVLLVDCGFAFYGSGEKFDSSAVEYPADPQGHVVACAKSALGTLAEPDARVMVYGYHSDLVAPDTVAPVPVKDSAAMFARVQTGNRDTYYSSALDRGLAGLPVANWKDYDVTLVVFSGGVLNTFRNASASAMKNDIALSLSSLRAAGVKVRAFCLDQSQILKDPTRAIDASFFGEGEYFAAPVESAEDIRTSYNRALQQMAADFIEMLLMDRGGQWTRLGPEETAVPEGAEIVTLDKNGNLTLGAYSQGTTLEPDTIAWMEGLPAADEGIPAPTDRALTTEEIVLDLIKTLHGELDGRTLTEEYSFPLDARIVPGKYSFYTDQTDVLEVASENGRLVLRPLVDGEAKLWCKDLDRGQVFSEDEFRPKITVEMPKPKIDYHLTWSRSEDAPSLTVGEALTVTASEGFLECTLEKVGGASRTLQTGRGELDGLKWSLDQNDAGQIALTLTPVRVGSYKVTCRLLSLDTPPEVAAEETRTLDVHQKLDPVEPLALYYPYYLKDGLAGLRLTSGGQPVSLDDYVIEAPEGLDVMTRTGGAENVLYVAPRSTGDMTLTVTEKDVRDPERLEISVRVRAVTSQVSLWLLGLGALLCAAGLSAALVILIGKALGRRG